MSVAKSRRLDDLRKLLETAIRNSEFEPDAITAKNGGIVVFTCRGLEVEDDGKGGWRPKAS